jgi:hypothetical protein
MDNRKAMCKRRFFIICYPTFVLSGRQAAIFLLISDLNHSPCA